MFFLWYACRSVSDFRKHVSGMMSAMTAWRVGGILAAALIALGIGIAYGSHTSSSPQSVARAIVSKCAGEQNHQDCYEREVPALYPKLAVPQIFSIIRQIRQSDPTYQF